MPLSREHQLAFIHVPKTGGSSVCRAFGIYKGRESLLGNNQIVDGYRGSPQHWPASKVRQHLGDEIEGWFTFSFVRDPYTRAVSEYLWQRQQQKKPKVWCPVKFEEWIKTIPDKQNYDHNMPQSFILDEPVDFLGRFESLKEDFKKLTKLIDVDVELPHRHKTKFKKPELVETLTNQSISVINDVYAEDFKNFDYKRRVASISLL